MQKTVKNIRTKITACPAKSAYMRGVKKYELELLDSYVENHNLTDESVIADKVTEKDLLNGAQNWKQYSYGGCSLIYDSDICDRLCTSSGKKLFHNGEKPPRFCDSWLDCQADALKIAASIVLRIANSRY